MSDKVRKALISLIQEVVPSSIVGEVKSVDESDYTCVVSPLDGGPDYESVRLKSTIDGSDEGPIVIPDKGSMVLISPIANDPHNYYLNKAERSVKWSLKLVGGGSIVIDNQGNVEINNGGHGGIVKIVDVVKAFNALEVFENKIIAINAAIQTLGTNTPGLPITAGVLAGLLSAIGINTVTLTTVFDLENTKVKHG